MDPPLDGTSEGALVAGPRAGAHPGRGAPRAAAVGTSCSCRTRGERDRSRSAAWPRSRRRRPGDLFFDIEGDPYAFDDGLDYLFGVLESGRDVHALLVDATTPATFSLDGEKRAFERLIDFIMERLERGPDAARLPLRARTSRPRSSA